MWGLDVGVHLNYWVLFSAVTKLIETAQPSIDFTQRKYGDAHDAVVASATYNRALEAAAEVLQRLQVCTEPEESLTSLLHEPQLYLITYRAWYTKSYVGFCLPSAESLPFSTAVTLHITSICYFTM